MTQNKFTTNNNPTLAAVSYVDGETPVYLYADPISHGLVIDGSISVGSVTNDGTFAKETGGNLDIIVTNTGKIPSLGQALAANSVPVVLTTSQLITLTPPSAITNYALETGGNLAALAAKDFATSAIQTTQQSSLTSIDGKLSGTLSTSGTTTELTGLMPKVFDYISANLSGSTADVYTYKAGGSGGTTAATLTVTWTDSTKTVLSTVVRT